MSYQGELLEEGVIRAEFFDEINEEDAKKFAADIDRFVDPAKGEKQIDTLNVFRGEIRLAAKTRRVFVKLNQNPYVGNHAFVGISRGLKVMVIFIVKVSGRENINFFDTESEALAWLAEAANNHRK